MSRGTFASCKLRRRSTAKRPAVFPATCNLRTSPPSALQRRGAVDEREEPGAPAARVVAEGISVRGLEEIVAVGVDEDDDGETVRFKARRPTAPGLAELNDRLSDRLDTRVKVTMGKAKGRIAIEFASLGDLERIVGIIDPRNRDDRPI